MTESDNNQHPWEEETVKKFRRLTQAEQQSVPPDASNPQPRQEDETKYLDEQLNTLPAGTSDSLEIPSPAVGMTAGIENVHDEAGMSQPAWSEDAHLYEHLAPGQIPPAPPRNGINHGHTPLPPPPLSQTPTPPLNLPAVDRSGMPLPRKVDQMDLHATRVMPVKRGLPDAAPPSNTGRGLTGRTDSTPTTRPVKPFPADNFNPPPPEKGSNGGNPNGGKFRKSGCLTRSLVILLFVLVIGLVVMGSYMVVEYYTIARDLPGIDDLKSHASQFETTRILDRDGNLLYEILDPTAGRRTYIPLEKISPSMVAATLATEDKDYYNHPGFNILAIARAMWQNYTSGEIQSGASTITQQLARSLLLSPDERYDQTIERKTKEIVLASEITRRYSKDEILELYLNENNYGNLAYGVEAAAETYFNTTADQLTLAQASFLAGIPQAPAIYDVNTNREATLNRQKQVLLLMLDTSKEQSCIFVSNASERVCVTDADVLQSISEIDDYPFKPVNIQMTFPHWVNYVSSLLEEKYDPQTIYRSGFTVYTTLDPDLQRKAEEVVKEQVAQLAPNNASDGALVAIRPSTGEILAMVGSADFGNEKISGQVNMAVSPRQPGSSIKPLTYTAAFEKGWTPATLIWDVPTVFTPSGKEDDQGDLYEPVNYDGNFHGPVTVRTALSNSYNIPAVKTLQFVGIYDNPNTSPKDGFIELAKRMGITTLKREDYGLSLTLGGGDVTLLELTGAYSIFANGGKRVQPVAITKIVDSTGQVVYEYKPPEGDQVIRADHAYLISSILSDQEARVPTFGQNPVINLPFTAAVKTGTTNDFRDNWTLGYTPDLAIGVWVGNADYTPMQNTTGLTGAAPIWAEMMKFGIQKYTDNNPSSFYKPDSIVRKTICAVSGTEPSDGCPKTRKEYFTADQPPLPKEQDIWQTTTIDSWTGLLASDVCGDDTEEVETIHVDDSAARKWLKQTDAGKAWLKAMGFKKPYIFTPSQTCGENDPHPTLKFTHLIDNQRVTSTELQIEVQAYGEGFKSVGLAWGEGSDPRNWTELVGQEEHRFRDPDVIYTWDLTGMPPGVVTLKLSMYNEDDRSVERIIHLDLQVPTPTATATATATETPLPTATSLPSLTPTVTPVPPTATAILTAPASPPPPVTPIETLPTMAP